MTLFHKMCTHFSVTTIGAILACMALPALSAPTDTVRKYERAGVYNPDLGKPVDLHYVFTESPDLGFKVDEQYYMDGCVRGFVKLEKIPDPDANLFKVLPGFGCEAYGIGFTLDYKKGWTLLPSKTTGKYPTGAFLLNWAETNNKKPAFVLDEK